MVPGILTLHPEWTQIGFLEKSEFNLSYNRRKSYNTCGTQMGLGPRIVKSRAVPHPNRPVYGMEADMDTHSPESRALLWTGSIIAAIVILALIAFYGGIIS